MHLVRDPRAMAHSALGRGRDLAPTVDWWVKTHLNLEARARELPSEHRMVLRYEDLGVAPTESLDRVYRVFGVRTSEECQLPEPDEYRDVEHHVSGGRAGGARAELAGTGTRRGRPVARTGLDRGAQRSHVGPLLARWGSASATSADCADPARTVGVSRRRNNRGRGGGRSLVPGREGC
ncbi:MAG: hypothetical protein U5R31_02925 [Acidimicrobiia bacterium]|nr:hypothetical protein [Acidimicrobiia bacterium]